MIASIGNFSKSFMAKVFVAIIALPFILWGMGDVFQSGNQNVIAEINENKIRYPFLDKKHNREYYPYANLDNTINHYVFEIMKEKYSNNSFLNKIFSGTGISYDLYQKEIPLKELELMILDFEKSNKNRLIDYAIEFYQTGHPTENELETIITRSDLNGKD